jgi:hypothetical protein
MKIIRLETPVYRARMQHIGGGRRPPSVRSSMVNERYYPGAYSDMIRLTGKTREIFAKVRSNANGGLRTKDWRNGAPPYAFLDFNRTHTETTKLLHWQRPIMAIPKRHELRDLPREEWDAFPQMLVIGAIGVYDQEPEVSKLVKDFMPAGAERHFNLYGMRNVIICRDDETLEDLAITLKMRYS